LARTFVKRSIPVGKKQHSGHARKARGLANTGTMTGLAHSGIPTSTADRCVKIENRPIGTMPPGAEPPSAAEVMALMAPCSSLHGFSDAEIG
jgi:hypothetical protein